MHLTLNYVVVSPEGEVSDVFKLGVSPEWEFFDSWLDSMLAKYPSAIYFFTTDSTDVWPLDDEVVEEPVPEEPPAEPPV